MNNGIKNTKRTIRLIILLIAVAAMAFAAFSACNYGGVKNGDFEKVGDLNLPKEWKYNSYLNDTSISVCTLVNDASRGKVLKISVNSDDDCRMIQTVRVKGDSYYRLSGCVKTEEVEGGAGANIALEDGFVYTDPVLGSADWQKVEMIGKTGKGQRELRIGCRIGNYGRVSKGVAYFDDVKLELLDSAPQGADIKDFNVKPGSMTGGGDEDTEQVNYRSDGEIEQFTARMRTIFITACAYILTPLIIFAIILFEKAHDKRTNNEIVTPAEQASSFFDTSAKELPKKTDTKLRYTKLDWIFVIVLTLVYAVLAVTNLGSVNFPTNEWKGKTGRTVVFDFGETVKIKEIWQNGGITGGSGSEGTTKYTLTSDSGKSIEAKQRFGIMYRWDKVFTSSSEESRITADRITLKVTAGEAWLNEIAFIGEDGKPIPVKVTEESAAALIDEQSKVPEYPNYMHGMYFDELYHARTAYEHINNLKVYETTHPPLGKIFISLGVRVFGMTPFGWRIVGALFGVAMVPLMYAFGKRMFKRPTLALLAAALMTFDFMHYTQTRISTIDVYGVFFNLAMTYYMYKFIKMDLGDSLKSTLVPLALSGIFFGIGCASKWICMYTGVALAVMFFGKLIVTYIKARNINRLKLTKEQQNEPAVINASKINSRTLKTVLWCIPFFLVIPLLIYLASYYPYYTAEWKPNAEKTKIAQMRAAEQSTENVELTLTEKAKAYVDGVIKNQEYMYNYHSGLKSEHAYQSNWYEWPLSGRPMWFHAGYHHPDKTLYGTISSFGNPAVWWICFFGTVFMFMLLITRRFKLNTELFFISICLASSMLPWMLIKRSVFIYHYFATVPLIILSSFYVLKHYEDKLYYVPKERGLAVGGIKKYLPFAKFVWIGIAVVLFAVFYPVITGIPVSKDYVASLQWLPTWTFMGYWPVIWPK